MAIRTRLLDRAGGWLDRRLARQWEKLNAEFERDLEKRPTIDEIDQDARRLRARMKLESMSPWSHPTARPYDDVMDTIARIEQERGRP